MALTTRMPYTPPSQRSPVMLASKPPNINRHSSRQTILTPNPSTWSRPALLTSTSYLTRHRRLPSTKPTIGQTASHDTQSELAPPGIAENAKDDVKAMVSKGALSHVRDQFTLFQKAKSKWLNPEASIGKFCGKKGKYSCWEAEGIAQDAFKEMSLDISALLERTCGPVPASSQVIYDMFMIGEKPETAVPQIMFSCRKPGPRKAAVDILKKSGILNNYPGVETGHWQFPPHIMDPRLLASDGEEAPMTSTTCSKALLVPLYASAETLSSPASSITMLAMQLYTDTSSDGCHPSLKATVGSRVCYAGKTFYISVAHAFVESDTCTPESSLDTEDKDHDSEFEFGGLSEGDEEFDDEELEITSSGSMSSESSGPDDASNDEITIDGDSESLSMAGSEVSTRKSTDDAHSGTSDNFRIGRQPFSRNLGPPDAAVANVFLASTDLDYALVEASNEDGLTLASDDLPLLSLGNVKKISPGAVCVMAVTGSSGPLFGVLSGRPSYIRLPSSMTFQETYTVTLDGPLNPGDSGSVVLNPETREVYGHIVAGSTSSRIAYIIPATNVLNDLERRQENRLHATTNAEVPSLQTHEYRETTHLRMVKNVTELQAATNIIGQQRASEPNHGPPQSTDDHHPLPRQTTGVSSSNTEPRTLVTSSGDETLMGSDEDVDSGDEQSSRKPPILKKSGKLIRPALRSVPLRRSASTPNSPARPFSKTVHFDSHLEHFQHFLQVNQPLVISAISSPTESYENDTELSFSDDDADGPSPSFEWEILVPNFPTETPFRMKLPVRVERVFLSSDNRSLICSIAVANLGIDKHVVARFTFDCWKTSLLVVAENTHDVQQPETDRYDKFNFIIKLADHGNLELKTMFFYVNYSVDGQEYYDDNNLANFQVDFQKKVKPPITLKTMGHSLLRRHSLRRSKAMPVSFDDFKRPFIDYLGESGSSPRSRDVKSAVSLASDSLNKRIADPNSGKAFGSRYDFGVALSAAIQAADSALGDRSGLTMKSMKPLPRNPTQIAASIHQDEPLAKKIGDEARERGKPVLASQSYNELLDKYCFFGSAKSSPQLKDGPLLSGTYDGINENGHIPGPVDSTPEHGADKFRSLERSLAGPARTVSSRQMSTTASATGSNAKCLTVSEAGPSLSAVSINPMIQSNS